MRSLLEGVAERGVVDVRRGKEEAGVQVVGGAERCEGCRDEGVWVPQTGPEPEESGRSCRCDSSKLGQIIPKARGAYEGTVLSMQEEQCEMARTMAMMTMR